MLTAFLSLFPNRYAYIYKPLRGHDWLSATEHWKLSDTEILKAAAAAHPKSILGYRPGNTTKFAILDIDSRSAYHTPVQLKRIVHTLRSAGLKQYSLYQSSNSEGWHLYVPFTDWIPSREINRNLTRLLRLHNFRVDKGQLEVFPNPGQTGSLGYGVRFPLQPGWAWLNINDQSVNYYREELSPAKAIEWFLRDLDEANTLDDYEQFKHRLSELESAAQMARTTAGKSKPSNVVPIRPQAPDIGSDDETVLSVFGFFPPGMNTSDWLEGRRYFYDGLTAPGQRAHAIFCLGHYLFYGDPERNITPLGYGYEHEREYAIKQILAAKNHNQSKDLNRGRQDALAQVTRASQWRSPAKRDEDIEPYKKAVPIAWLRHNANLKNNARKRITDAVNFFVEARHPFSMRELADKAKCSKSTVQRHPDLWKALQTALVENRFAAVPNEYNAVEGASLTQTSPPATVLENLMPPGRLAARRIAYELSKRAKREREKKERYSLNTQNASPGCACQLGSTFRSIATHTECSCSWQQKVESLIPADLKTAAAADLKVSLVVLQKYLALSPDYEHQMWLLAEMEKIRAALSETQKQWKQDPNSS